MKRRNVQILFVAIISAAPWLTYTVRLFASNSFPNETVINKSSYILGADQEAIKWKDTTYYYASKLRNSRYAEIPVYLTNVTSDTLKYINMSCSQLDVFTTSTSDSKIFQELDLCFSNYPTCFTLGPYASARFKVPVYFLTEGTLAKRILTPKQFKIGMALIRYDDRDASRDDFYRIKRKDPDDLIWSNVITAQ